MDGEKPPHPKNVPGPFYVLDQCCLTCGVPHYEAPEHFEFDDGYAGCYVKRQPCNQAEVTRMISAMMVQDLDCIRYRGRDPKVLERLAAIGSPELADYPPAEGLPAILRNRVTFTVSGGDARLDGIVADFRSHWLTREDRGFRGPFGGIFRTMYFDAMWMPTEWRVKRDSHRIWIAFVDKMKTRVQLFHSPRERRGSRGVSYALREWLAASQRYVDIRWFSQQEWDQRRDGYPTPW